MGKAYTKDRFSMDSLLRTSQQLPTISHAKRPLQTYSYLAANLILQIRDRRGIEQFLVIDNTHCHFLLSQLAGLTVFIFRCFAPETRPQGASGNRYHANESWSPKEGVDKRENNCAKEPPGKGGCPVGMTTEHTRGPGPPFFRRLHACGRITKEQMPSVTFPKS